MLKYSRIHCLCKDGGVEKTAANNGQNAEKQEQMFGIKELDNAMQGAMRKGNVYMVSGKSGSGKTTLCTHFLAEGVRHGERVAIILTGTRAAEYIANSKTFSFGFEEYYKNGAIEVIELSDAFRSLKAGIGSASYIDTKRYIARLSAQIRETVAASGMRRVAIDPITPMLINNDDFIARFFEAIAIPNVYMLVTSGALASELSIFGYEEYHVAGVIKLENMEAESMEGGDGRAKKATIVKMRGSEYDPKPFIFEINKDGIVPYARNPGNESLFSSVKYTARD